MWIGTRRVTLTVISLLTLVVVLGLAATAYAQTDYTVEERDKECRSTTLNFHFSTTSYIPGEVDRVAISGSGQICGKFKVGEVVTKGKVDAEGSFAHYDGTMPGPNNIRFDFTGTWYATKLVSFQLLGFYGPDSAGKYPLAAGVLVMEINLVRPPSSLIPLTSVPSLLTLVSNVKPATVFDSGQPDGATLLAPNQPGGFLFIPIPFESSAPAPMGQAYMPVMFTTLKEDRHHP